MPGFLDQISSQSVSSTWPWRSALTFAHSGPSCFTTIDGSGLKFGCSACAKLMRRWNLSGGSSLLRYSRRLDCPATSTSTSSPARHKVLCSVHASCAFHRTFGLLRISTRPGILGLVTTSLVSVNGLLWLKRNTFVSMERCVLSASDLGEREREREHACVSVHLCALCAECVNAWYVRRECACMCACTCVMHVCVCRLKKRHMHMQA